MENVKVFNIYFVHIFLNKVFTWKLNLQKQSLADIVQNKFSYKFHKFQRKTPVLESLCLSEGLQLY